MVGKTLGHYEILEPLGAGGMGEVYRARDTKLDRDVAIKVLPEDFATDQDRLARFEREAKLLAQLNHANIATIHGLEDADGLRFIAMECVEGETLAEQIARQGRIEVAEALEIARQIAEALGAAHENGVIHRDLKPANVKVTLDGKVKVLDFGLAKAYEPDGSPSEISPDLSHSPTMAAATRTGVILGTAAYMSPEQARGKPVDRRADVFSFGAVLYEMLAGSRAFDGETVSDTLAAILKEDPDWGRLPTNLAPPIVRLLRRCLRREPPRRLQHVGDARIEIEEVIAGSVEDRPAANVGGANLGARVLPWAIAAAALLVAAVVGFWRPSATAPSQPYRRFDITLPAEAPLVPSGEMPLAWGRPALAISTDGQTLAWAALVNGVRRLYVRDMGTGETRSLDETEGALAPFFSPDGREIGFFADGRLKKIALAGGPPTPLEEASTPFGGGWASDGTIYYAPGGGIFEIPAAGGSGMRVSTPGIEFLHALPILLPGEHAILYGWGFGGIVAHSLDSGDGHLVHDSGFQPRYVEPGFLLVSDRGTLSAIRFDPAGLRTIGQSSMLLDDLRTEIPGGAAAQFAVSSTGTLVYAAGNAGSEGRLAWADRDGEDFELTDLETGLVAYSSFRLSKDGTKVAIPIDDGVNQDLFIYDFGRGDKERMTFGGLNANPVWAADDRHLLYSVDEGENWNVVWQPIDRSAEPITLIEGRYYPSSVSADGEVLALTGSGAGVDGIWTFPLAEKLQDLEAQLEPERFIVNSAGNFFPAFAPNGRWLAYTTSETNRFEVYVRRYPEGDGVRRVSVGGGEEPVWSADGSEIFYRFGTRWYVVDVTYEPEFELAAPQELFQGPFINLMGMSYDVAPDAQRFLVVYGPDVDQPVSTLKVITNLPSLLEQLLGAG